MPGGSGVPAQQRELRAARPRHVQRPLADGGYCLRADGGTGRRRRGRACLPRAWSRTARRRGVHPRPLMALGPRGCSSRGGRFCCHARSRLVPLSPPVPGLRHSPSGTQEAGPESLADESPSPGSARSMYPIVPAER